MEISLDQLLTLTEAAKLWRMTPRELAAKSKGPAAQIPGYWINRKIVRFHPRAMFAKAAADAGIAPELIAAMFTTTTTETPKS